MSTILLIIFQKSAPSIDQLIILLAVALLIIFILNIIYEWIRRKISPENSPADQADASEISGSDMNQKSPDDNAANSPSISQRPL